MKGNVELSHAGAQKVISAEYSELLESDRKTAQLAARVRALEDELAFTRHTLAYRVGAAIVENMNFARFWRIPMAIYRAIADYRSAKTARIVDQADQNSGDAADLLRTPKNPNWPEPVDRHLLWQAQHIGAADSLISACDFVEIHGDERHEPGLNLLRSNLHTSDDMKWLAGVNGYLKQFELAPLRLLDGERERFFRLSTDTLTTVTDGPLVSVIMPAFNSEDTIEKAMRSILNQTWHNLELIVNDDCSSDATYAIALAIAEEDSRVRVYRNAENVGPYVSKNKALQVARGDFITGHDADDWAHPQRIEQQVQGMLDNPSWQISTGYMVRIRETGYFSHFSKMGKTSPDGALRIASISSFFRADFLRNVVGHWDSVRFGADSEMIERCRRILSEEEFGNPRLLTMLCLDGEDSLTNDPNHGISKLTGVSRTRQFYREQWSAWHDGLTADAAFLEFPAATRKFSAPAEALVTKEEILRVLSDEASHRR